MKTNKRKQLPLLLLALLLISFGAYGTKAYFTDQTSQEAGLQITLGDLQISTEKDSAWEYKPGKGNTNRQLNKERESEGIYTNAQPGDKFTRTFKFENTGSLEQNVKIDAALSQYELGLYKITIDKLTFGGEKLDEESEIENKMSEGMNLKPDGIITMLVSIKVSTEGEYKHNETDLHGKLVNTNNDVASTDKILDLMKKMITVTAQQTNAPNN